VKGREEVGVRFWRERKHRVGRVAEDEVEVVSV